MFEKSVTPIELYIRKKRHSLKKEKISHTPEADEFVQKFLVGALHVVRLQVSHHTLRFQRMTRYCYCKNL